MSVDIKWETISSGADGKILAEKIRSFVQDKFQQITLPRFIRSVEVHSFDFGKVCPDLEIKDICDPLPEFYEHDELDDDDGSNSDSKSEHMSDTLPADFFRQRSIKKLPSIDTQLPPMRSSFDVPNQTMSPFPRSGTPGIPGGTSNLSYFHLPLGGISGAQTPLAAVASGTPFPNSRSDFSQPSKQLDPVQTSSPPRPSTADSILTAVSPGEGPVFREDSFSTPDLREIEACSEVPLRKEHEAKPEDIQIVSHVKYAGDVRLSLTAEILLDYPMPSFVGIPLKLSITGLTFDGLAVLAYIRKRAHFCFLSPEDARVVVGERSDASQIEGVRPPTVGGLLQEIHVESEIGKKDNGKQVLKNVGKVERFVLEQVRRIFEEELVFPSFWTFLV